jgi:hypothetical protein
MNDWYAANKRRQQGGLSSYEKNKQKRNVEKSIDEQIEEKNFEDPHPKKTFNKDWVDLEKEQIQNKPEHSRDTEYGIFGKKSQKNNIHSNTNYPGNFNYNIDHTPQEGFLSKFLYNVVKSVGDSVSEVAYDLAAGRPTPTGRTKEEYITQAKERTKKFRESQRENLREQSHER